MKPTVRHQTAVVEFHGGDWMVMLPDGRVEVLGTALAALAAVQRAARRGNKGVTLTQVEWRNVPEGWQPPAGSAR